MAKLPWRSNAIDLVERFFCATNKKNPIFHGQFSISDSLNYVYDPINYSL